MEIRPIFLRLLFFAALWTVSGAELDIVCTTDLHGRYRQMPALAALIRSSGDKTLKIDVGDTLTGTLFSDLSGGRPMIALLNKLSFDVWVPGNHDFELGHSVLKQRMTEFKGTVLGIQWHWGSLRPAGWKMFEINGVKAAVIGATDPAMPRRILPRIDGVFKDTTEAVAAIMPEIRKQKPHVIILAYHNGEYSRYGNVYSLCRRFPEIDLVLGGHSHQEVCGKNLRRVYFVQAGAHGSCIGRIKIRVDDNTGKISRIESGLYYPDPRKIDPEIQMLCRKWQTEEHVMENTPVAATQALYRLPVRKDKFSRLGSLGAEALLKASGADAALFSLPEVKKQEFPLKNPQGRFVINEKILFGLFPFSNRICLIEFERQDLAELEAFVRDNSRKHKRRYFFAGALTAGKNGRLNFSKQKILLAVSDYILTSTPVLQRKLETGGKWSLIPGLFERDVMRKALQNCR